MMKLKELMYSNILFKPHKVSKKMVKQLVQYHVRKKEKWIFFFKKKIFIKWFIKNAIFPLRIKKLIIKKRKLNFFIVSILNIYFLFLSKKKIYSNFFFDKNDNKYLFINKNIVKKKFFLVVEGAGRFNKKLIVAPRQTYTNYFKNKIFQIKRELWKYKGQKRRFNKDELSWELTYAQFMKNRMKKKKRGKNFYLNSFRKRCNLRFLVYNNILKERSLSWLLHLELRCDYVLVKINFLQNLYFAQFLIKKACFLINGIQKPLYNIILNKGDNITPTNIFKYIIYILLRKRLYNQIWLNFINKWKFIQWDSKNEWFKNILNKRKYSVFMNNSHCIEVNYRLMFAIIINTQLEKKILTYSTYNNYNCIAKKKKTF